MIKNILSVSLMGFIVNALAMETIFIGTGNINGTYYPTGKHICDFFNKTTDPIHTKNRCQAISTEGSRYNIQALENSSLEFGIAQSDLVYQAFMGEGVFKEKKISHLRSVISIYPELLAFIVRKDAQITTFNDIKKKRINLGSAGSGTETTIEILFDTFHISKNDLLQWSSLTIQDAQKVLNKNRLDGYFYMVGHPAKNIIPTETNITVDIIPIQGKKVDKLIAKYPYYAKGYIPADTYKGISKDIQSIGVQAVLVTHKDIDDKIVKKIIKNLLDNFEEFKLSHPAYKSITKESLIQGLSAPLHKSAENYYKKIGLIQ